MNLRMLRPFAYPFLAWTVIGLLYFAQNVTRRFYWDDPNPWQDIRYWSVNIYVSALLTPLILWAGRRWPLERANLPRILALHLLLSVGWAVTRLAIEAAIQMGWEGIRPSNPPVTFKDEITLLYIFGFHTAVVAYWVVLSVQSAFSNYARFQERAQAALRSDLRASQLETQMAQARLGALKAQLQPHFLFNTLNAIASLIPDDPPAAEEMVEALSELLRAALSEARHLEIPLEREMELLDQYVRIQSFRFQDRLRVRVDVEPALGSVLVPPLLLQPLLENAIRHAVAPREGGGSLAVSVEARDTLLQLTVADDGPGFTSEPTDGEPRGIGLANTRARLDRLYGKDAAIEIGNHPGGGGLVNITLPLHRGSLTPTALSGAVA